MISRPYLGVSDTLWVGVGRSFLVSPSLKSSGFQSRFILTGRLVFFLNHSSLTRRHGSPAFICFSPPDGGKVKTLNGNLEGFVNDKKQTPPHRFDFLGSASIIFRRGFAASNPFINTPLLLLLLLSRQFNTWLLTAS